MTTLSIIVPVYRNEENLSALLSALGEISNRARGEFNAEVEVVFVDDASPDGCSGILARRLPSAPFDSQLLLHSRNFGSFAAIRSGLEAATGDYFTVISADLQEPPELVLQFLELLATGKYEVVVGCRESRDDPYLSSIASKVFWILYKKFVIPEISEKGVDVFGCNLRFREELLRLGESNSALIGLIYWLGFRRAEVMYKRQKRILGKSAWSLKKKVTYLLDSVFSFTDLPIRLLTFFGLFGLLVSVSLGLVIFFAKLYLGISVPGYAATLLTVLFFGAINSLGIGVIGTYAWRAYENTKCRPLAIVMATERFKGGAPPWLVTLFTTKQYANLVVSGRIHAFGHLSTYCLMLSLAKIAISAMECLLKMMFELATASQSNAVSKFGTVSHLRMTFLLAPTLRSQTIASRAAKYIPQGSRVRPCAKGPQSVLMQLYYLG